MGISYRTYTIENCLQKQKNSRKGSLSPSARQGQAARRLTVENDALRA